MTPDLYIPATAAEFRAARDLLTREARKELVEGSVINAARLWALAREYGAAAVLLEGKAERGGTLRVVR